MEEREAQALLSLSAGSVQNARRTRFESFAHRAFQGEPATLSSLLVWSDIEHTLEACAIPHAGSPQLRLEEIAPVAKAAFEIERSSGPTGRETLVRKAALGLVGQRPAEVRHLLRNLFIEQPIPPGRPAETLRERLFNSFLLIAKQGGVSGLGEAAEIVEQTRTEVASWSANKGDEAPDRGSVAEMMGYSYALKGCELVANYLAGLNVQIAGRPVSGRGLRIELSRLMSEGAKALRAGGVSAEERHQLNLIHSALSALVESSFNSLRLPASLAKVRRTFVTRQEDPRLSLWPSQRKAIQSGLLDPTKVAIVVSMPTSAGKTMLAELAIEQALSENPGSRVVYLAPTRALVNQVAQTLRRDLERKTRIASPVFELDPVENRILSQDLEILVTTPEKMDLLLREDHPCVDDISLVVVDEAHNLAGGARGTRLEMLLTTLRNERNDCRLLLLTPFAKNANKVATWLGESDSEGITVDWAPSSRVVSVAQVAKLPNRTGSRLHLETLNSPHSNCPAELTVDLGRALKRELKNKKTIIEQLVKRWDTRKRSGVLILCETTNKAMERAREISATQESISDLPSDVQAICAYLDEEVSGDHPMSALLRKGVAFHHAGLSSEARFLIEGLVSDGHVKFLCATTTLAQGMHFPLSLAIIESHYHPDGAQSKVPMTPSEFWNIAGRVGRAGNDEMGLVSFVASNKSQAQSIKDFVQEDAGELVSALEDTLQELQGTEFEFNTATLVQHPPLSAFLQYIVHAVATLGEEGSRQRLSSMLRGSFVLRRLEETNQELVGQVLVWAQNYLEDLLDKKRSVLSWWAKAVDSTGLSSPSSDLIYASLQDYADEKHWVPESLITPPGEDAATLTKAIEVMAKVPEIQLGTYFQGEFDPERVARIVQAWVAGHSIRIIADREYKGDVLRCTKNLNSAVSMLVPWGLRAIHRMLLSTKKDVNWRSIDRTPAMVFHGVKSEEAVALRMAGVPRFAAEGMADEVRRRDVPIEALDDWLGTADDKVWSAGLSEGSNLAPDTLRDIWRKLEGRPKE